MTKAFLAILDPDIALCFLIVDFPRSDICEEGDWDCAIDAAIVAKALSGRPIAMVASLPELMSEHVALRLMEGGVIPLCGLSEALRAVEAAQKRVPRDLENEILQPSLLSGEQELLPESVAKAELATFDLPIPAGGRFVDPVQGGLLAKTLIPPLVLKGEGLAHKSESGAVKLKLSRDDIPLAIEVHNQKTKRNIRV